MYVALTGEDTDRPIRVYDVDSGRLIAATGSAPLNESGAFAGDLSPDGSTFAVTTASKVLRVDTETLRFVRPDLRGETGDYLDRLEYSNDGSRLAAATREGRILVWDTGTGDVVHRFEEGWASWGLDFSADGSTLYSAGGLLSAWDLSGEHGLFSVGKASDLAEYAVSKPAPNGRTLVRERLGLMWFVDNETGRETATRSKQTHDWYHVWSPDSKWLLSWRDRGTLRLWETATAHLVAQRRITGGVVPAFSPSSDQVYVNDLREDNLLVLDRASLKPARAPIDLGTPVLGLVPHPDDGSVFGLAHDGGVLRVVPHTGDVARVAPSGTFPYARAWEAELSPDGTRMLGPNLNGEDAEVQLVDATTWERFGAAAPWIERFGTFDLAPDGAQYASQDDDGIALFDGVTGARQATIPCRRSRRSSASPTSPTAAACSWPASTGGPGPWRPALTHGWIAPVRPSAVTSPARSGRSTSPIGPSRSPVPSGRPAADPSLGIPSCCPSRGRLYGFEHLTWCGVS